MVFQRVVQISEMFTIMYEAFSKPENTGLYQKLEDVFCKYMRPLGPQISVTEFTLRL